MKRVFDSGWRAALYCLHPRVIGLSLLPSLLLVVVTFGVAYFFWHGAVDLLNLQIEQSFYASKVTAWMDDLGMQRLKVVLPHILILLFLTPVLVVVSMLVVSYWMAPALVAMVAERRFTTLEALGKPRFLSVLLWALGSVLMAFFALVLSMPLWLIPPLVILAPPIIWGWLTYRIMAFDALSIHASTQERRTIFRTHRFALIGIGVIVGFVGGIPSLMWSMGLMAITLAPFLVPLVMWLYMVIFAFASLWFAHYCLSVLSEGRGAAPTTAVEPNHVLTAPLNLD